MRNTLLGCAHTCFKSLCEDAQNVNPLGAQQASVLLAGEPGRPGFLRQPPSNTGTGPPTNARDVLHFHACLKKAAGFSLEVLGSQAHSR